MDDPGMLRGGGPPVLGRASAAASAEPLLRRSGGPESAAIRAEGGSAGPWTVRAVSITGVRHRLAGAAGDDAYAWFCDGSRLAVAVADGLGSVEGSGVTAGLAARTAVDRAGQAPEGSGPVDAAADGVRAANDTVADKAPTTLVVAVVDGEGRVGLARVGDSTAFMVLDGGHSWTELFPASAEDGAIETATEAIPSPSPRVEYAEVALEEDSVLVLLTDGLADPWRDGPTTVAPVLATALGGRPDATLLCALVDFSRHGCHDDRALVSVWRRGSE